ncbi:MAG: hypothetical protein COA73_16470 [Candidatus Hydrogenedentota bacterium]|nr:MAG: hypothetical protein COA73_16470 [Candidatus Hydrogenedentota bacterium]
MAIYTTIALRNWLATATRGIASWDKERIEREIHAHYEDAVADGLAQGLHQEEAEHAALESLGSAKKARRKNRKTCSSASTEKIMDRMMEHHPRKGKFVPGMVHWITAFFFTPLCIGSIIAMFAEQNPFALASTTIVIPIVLMWYLLFIAIPDFVNQGSLKKAYIAFRLFFLTMMTGGMLPNLFKFDLTWNIYAWISLLGLFGYCYEFQKELHKIPKHLSRDDVLKG